MIEPCSMFPPSPKKKVQISNRRSSFPCRGKTIHFHQEIRKQSSLARPDSLSLIDLPACPDHIGHTWQTHNLLYHIQESQSLRLLFRAKYDCFAGCHVDVAEQAKVSGSHVVGGLS